MKKLIFLTLVLLVPSAYAYDFGTAGIVAALGVAGATLALVFGAPAALGTVAIGSLVAGITFPTPSSDSSATGAVEVQLSPSAQLATPSGWTAPTSGQVEPTPPSSQPSTGTQYYITSTCCTNDKFPTALEACKNLAVKEYGDDPSYYSVSGAQCLRFGSVRGNISTTVGCPSGYAYNGTTCDLQDPNQAMKPSDDRCTIKRTGNSFAVDPRDPDCASGKIPATTSISPNIITTTNSDGSTKSVQINADGSSTITESRPNNSNNTTETNTTTLSAPNASGSVSVTGQGSGVAPGTGTQAGSSAPPLNINFDKSGLATEGTLAGIKSDTGAIKDSLTAPSGTDTSLGDASTGLDNATDGVVAGYNALPTDPTHRTWSTPLDSFLFPSTCGCSPFTATAFGRSFTFDFCDKWEMLRNALSWIVYMLGAFSIFGIMLNKTGGGK